MSYRSVPPIQYVPVFEAAARHLSFKLAAQELCVTAPAIAQQVKAFEHWLGRPLFNRHTRALSLTPEGLYYYELAQKTMKSHCLGHLDYQKQFEKKSLTVSAPYFVAQELLMPNYLKFSDYCPGTELRIETRMSYVDFDSETIDAAVRFGDGQWPNLECDLLANASVAPVCGFNYEFNDEFSEIARLYEHRLIYAEPEMSDWGKTFWPTGSIQKFDNIICDSYIAAINAAADGLGVAMGIFPTLNSWINNKRLMMPFEHQIEIDRGYWLVSPKQEKETEEMTGLTRWIEDIFKNIPALDE